MFNKKNILSWLAEIVIIILCVYFDYTQIKTVNIVNNSISMVPIAIVYVILPSILVSVILPLLSLYHSKEA